MQFEYKLIYTGQEERTSKKTNEKYKIVNFLNESGQTFGVIAKCVMPEIKQLQQVKAKFHVNTGRYFGLELIDITVL